MRAFVTTTIAGTITTGGVSKEIAPRNPRRDLLLLQNPTGETGVLFYSFGAPATADGTCLGLAPGEWVQFDERCGVPGEAIHVNASNSGHKFVLLLGQRAGIG
jgi:hypothetical protein